MAKRMRLPNGFGQISEIKGRKLRKPFRAMVTVGKSDTGRPICKPLKPEAYFRTYNEAYAALLEYSKSPYDFSKDMTLEELYEKWSPGYYKKIKNPRLTIAAWKYLEPLHKYNVRDIKAQDIKKLLDNATIRTKNGEVHSITPIMKTRVKSTLNLLLDYAMEFEIVDKNVSRNIKLDSVVSPDELEVKTTHKAFSYVDMLTLWNNQGNIIVDMILVDCYSGWRPQELCDLTVDSINLVDWTMMGGSKTKAGKDRIVPIHSCIKPILLNYYNEAKQKNRAHLFTIDGAPFKYSRYWSCFSSVVEELSLTPGHRPHDCRKHFVTACKKYNVDEYAIKYLAGHAIQDLTERVYTERSIEWLKTEIEKIKMECRNGVGVEYP